MAFSQRTHHMKGRPKQASPPTFFWQGMVILLPVLALTGFGLFSLRQDKFLVRSEAEDRARELAKALAEEVWNELTGPLAAGLSTRIQFQINPDGQLLFPEPYQGLPQPQTYPFETLDNHQQSLWIDLLSSQVSEGPERSFPALATAFLDTHPPESFAAGIHFRLGTWLALQGKGEEALAQFQMILGKYPKAKGETGLPLQPLASLKWLELYSTQHPPSKFEGVLANALEQTCSNAVHTPSSLTPLILEKAFSIAGTASNQVRQWQGTWARHEWSRQLWQRLQAQWSQAGLTRPALQPSKTGSLEEISFTGFPMLTWIEMHDADGEGQETNWLVIQTGRNEQGTQYRGLPSAYITSMFEDQPQSRLIHAGPSAKGDHGEPDTTAAGAEATHEGLARVLERLPDYALATVEVAGTLWTIGPTEAASHSKADRARLRPGQSGTGQASASALEVLASAVFPSMEAQGIKIGVELAQPALLFAQQRQRTWWFGLLIAGAALTAAVGYLLAYRAFGKQQRLAEMKSNFVSSVSHELRAPIASVRLMAEGLDRGTIRDVTRQSEYYRFIVQECRRLSSMIENVLDFSRIDQGQKQYEFEPTDLSRLVEDSVKLMRPTAAERNIELRTDLQLREIELEERHPVLDGQALQRALINLIDNAIKHSSAGGTVWVDCHVRNQNAQTGRAGFPAANHDSSSLGTSPASGEADSTGNQDAGSVPPAWPAAIITLSVRDQGPGIPLEDQRKIFERFYRRGSELRRETQGIGIGLSIVKHIVEAHGGTVRVESQPGQGSRFLIDLPMTAH